jgi:hypothetical protein
MTTITEYRENWSSLRLGLCIGLVLSLVLFPGCLARQLRPETAAHVAQTMAVCRACEAGECDEIITVDACETATQACAIDAIVRGEDGAACQPSP